MAKIARSARGEVVDFDVISIKQALASAPISIGTEERRQFIDTKNGLKPKTVKDPQNALKVLTPSEDETPLVSQEESSIADAMKLAMAAAAASLQVAEDLEKPVKPSSSKK